MSAPRSAQDPLAPTDAPARRVPPTSSRLDRADARGGRSRDGLGKEALYSTAPTAAPAPQVELRCQRCDVPIGRTVVGVIGLLSPPFLWDPFHGRLWTRCPACERRSWLTLRTGQALRVLLDRPSGPTAG